MLSNKLNIHWVYLEFVCLTRFDIYQKMQANWRVKCSFSYTIN